MQDRSGQRLEHYVLGVRIGAGGMGEVYRASDTRLGREVAVKLLPPAFTQDEERLSRFEREARLLASLNHPNIAAIYGVAESDGARALVMEFVEGPTLAERIALGPILLEEALSLFRQIAEALEAAHAQGIIHRDLKPQNIKIRPDGTVKVLDFGLAKGIDSARHPQDADLTHSPTLNSPAATQAGMIMGTAAYMAPEQAKGKELDKRADLWAFGVVMYESLTGQSLFRADSVTETLAAVLRAEIDWGTLPAPVPGPLRDLLKRCLARDPRRRLHDAADARIVIEDVASGSGMAELPPQDTAPGAAGRSRVLVWAGGALLAGVLLTTLAMRLLQSPAAALPDAGEGTLGSAALPPASFRQLTALPGGEGEPSLAPDGESFVYVKSVKGQTDIFLQRVDGANPINLTPGCPEDDRQPAFSPDGRQIAYRSACSGGGIFVMGATGESSRKITETGFSPAWSPDGSELAVVEENPNLPWGRTSDSPLWAVAVSSGARRKVSEHDAMHPSWSPGGKRIAFWGLELEGTGAQRDLWTVPADGSLPGVAEAVAVVEDAPLDWNPVWAADGRSLFFSSTRGGTLNLWRIFVDPESGRPLGPPQPVTVPSSWAGWISASRDGRRLIFVDRNAQTTIYRAPFDPLRGELAGPPVEVPLGTVEVHEVSRLSPDGRLISFSNAGLPTHLFVAAADGSGVRQLTQGEFRDRMGTISPDGKWLAFQTTRCACPIGLIGVDGSALRLVKGDRTQGWYPTWSPDGRRLALSETAGSYLLTLAEGEGESAVEPLPQPEGGLRFWPTTWSSDGRLLAGDLLSTSGAAGIAVLSLADGKYRVISTGRNSGPVFVPSGRSVIWSSETGLWIQDLDSDVARPLLTISKGQDVRFPSLSADGRWLAWRQAADESDIWMAELADSGVASK